MSCLISVVQPSVVASTTVELGGRRGTVVGRHGGGGGGGEPVLSPATTMIPPEFDEGIEGWEESSSGEWSRGQRVFVRV